MFDITEVDTSNTDESITVGNGTTTSSDSTDDNDSTTSSGSSSDGSTTSSDAHSTTDGSTTNNSTTSSDDNGTTSSDDNGSTTSTTSSDDEDEEDDTFELGVDLPSNYLSQRRKVKQRQAMARAQQRGGDGAKRKKPSTGPNNNLILTGAVEDEDNASVMTGMTGATGMHSVSSQATNQVNNRMVLPMSIGGLGDDSSVMTGVTGVSGATRKVANTGGAKPLGGTWRM